MIHVEGNDVKVGNATGLQLIEEASKAVYGVFLILKQAEGKDISDHELLLYILTQVGKNLVHMDERFDTEIKEKKLKGKPDDLEDFMSKVFGDLLNGGKDD